MANYTLQYPPTHNATYVKATTCYSGTLYPHFATDPAKSLTGGSDNNSWMTSSNFAACRFHIDLGTAKYIRRIYYENWHHFGGYTNRGIKDFTFWGSNNAAAFAELTYGTDTNWTQLTIGQSTFDIHVSANQADPKYILVTNAVAYRYYAFKCATTYTETAYGGLRRISLMTEDGYPPYEPPKGGLGIGNPWIFMKDMWEKHNKIWRPNKKILIPQGI